MALKEVWIGSVGPFLYEDTDTYEDGEDLRGLRVEQMFMDNAPASDNEVLRRADIDTDITNHSTQHENGGSDEIDVGGLSGLLTDDQHVLDAEVLAVAAAKGNNNDITFMTGLNDDGIPRAKVVGTIKADQVDAELSGTAKVFTIYSGSTPYYFKAYPTKA